MYSETMALIAQNFKISPLFPKNSDYNRRHSRVRIQCFPSESVRVNVGEKESSGSGSGPSIDVGNGHLRPPAQIVKDDQEKLEVLWDDGYGTQTVKDYFELAKGIIKHDGGPPRWFAPISCGPPLKDSPSLFFLPGADGTGLGLTLHEKALGKVFELWCLHIPVHDRTPFQGLIKIVEQTIRMKHASSPNMPIYLVGDSLGGCLALAVAARNPKIDLVVILANPATSFGRSQLQPLFPLLEALPGELQLSVPYLLSLVMGDPMKMAMVDIDTTSLPPSRILEQFSGNLTSLLPVLSGLADIIPKETLMWKLKLLKYGSSYANSRLHAVTAEVLVLASGKDNMLPSANEAERLAGSLRNCKVRYFKHNGHTILMEDHVNLLTIIKCTSKYRRSKRHDFVLDYLPPSMSEYKRSIAINRFYRNFTGAAMFSTTEDGKMVRGLGGIPDEGPVLLVGYHMLMGLELIPLIEEMLTVKKILVRGMAHPALFSPLVENKGLNELSFNDSIRLYGGAPVTGSNLFKMLANKSHVLLYPGGAREALHKKGEEYKVVWPEQPEFVRMAARFGATIVPFGVVGEDDIVRLVLDYDDMMKIPILNDRIRSCNENAEKLGFTLRSDMDGEVANQALYVPGLLAKVPGRLYYLFGKPISTKGKWGILKDREKARELYMEIKCEVENNMAYLLKKREEDPYRSIVHRTAYRAFSSPFDQIPSFDID